MMLLFFIKGYCQLDGFYESNNGSLLVIKNDSVAYRLLNEGGLISYNYGFGVFEIKNNNVLLINSCDDFRKFSAKKEERKDVTEDYHFRITLLNNELHDASNYIMLIDSVGDIKFGGLLDEQGNICIDLKKHPYLLNNNFVLKVVSLVFETSINVIIRNGFSYNIYSNIDANFPFSYLQKKYKFKIAKLTIDSLILKDEYNQFLFFKKKLCRFDENIFIRNYILKDDDNIPSQKFWGNAPKRELLQ